MNSIEKCDHVVGYAISCSDQSCVCCDVSISENKAEQDSVEWKFDYCPKCGEDLEEKKVTT